MTVRFSVPLYVPGDSGDAPTNCRVFTKLAVPAPPAVVSAAAVTNVALPQPDVPVPNDPVTACEQGEAEPNPVPAIARLEDGTVAPSVFVSAVLDVK